MKTIAIFGGTFDPIHLGHLQSALELKQRLQLDELRMLPCHLPPHRGSPGCSSRQRLEMVRLACADTGLSVDDRELRRSGTSFSVDTLEELRAELGDAVSIIWVMGADAFNGLDTWHRWRDVLQLAHIVVIARPGETLPADGPVAELLQCRRTDDPERLRGAPCGCILPLSLSPYAIAATDIRASLKKGEAVDHVLPGGVVNYINTHHLYR